MIKLAACNVIRVPLGMPSVSHSIMEMVFLGKLRGSQDILLASWEPEQNEAIFTKFYS
jgi:hypothetical protein